MLKEFRDKSVKTKKTKAVVHKLIAFYFPEQQKTIYASSRQEALKKFNKSN